MKYLIARKNHEVFAQIASLPLLLAFDFDGTLAPIVSDRNSAVMRTETVLLFHKICLLYPVAVISGRSKMDTELRLQKTNVKYIVGNHGLELGTNIEHFEHEIKEITPQLQAALHTIPGIDIENKRYSLAIHYRKTQDPEAACLAIENAVNSLPQRTRIIHGKFVVNVVPNKAPNKGDALLELCSREGVQTAFYVGDDITDEDVFRLKQEKCVVGIRVGCSLESTAQYFLREQREIDILLAWLYEFRTQTNQT